MRRPLRVLPLALALALAGPVCVPGDAGAVQPTTLAQAEGPQDDGPSPPDEERPSPTEDRPDPNDDRPAPADERQAPPEEEIPGPEVPPRAGETRRIDPFDAVDDDTARTPHPAALAHPDHDVVVCEAGCDKTVGAIVYMKKRE
jgi:hypothetical protein